MKYVKTFEAGKRKEKSTDKYLTYLYEIFDATIIKIDESYDHKFTIKLQYRGINNKELNPIYNMITEWKSEIYIHPTYGNWITVEFTVTSDYFEQFDIKISSKKYNLG